MLSCLLSWMRGEWADHTYSPTLTETFIALYVNKGFQCTVGQRLESTMGAPLLNSHSRASRVQRTCWKECAQYCFKHGYLSTLILELKYKFTRRIFRFSSGLGGYMKKCNVKNPYSAVNQFCHYLRWKLSGWQAIFLFVQIWFKVSSLRCFFFSTFGWMQFSRGFYIWDVSLGYR